MSDTPTPDELRAVFPNAPVVHLVHRYGKACEEGTCKGGRLEHAPDCRCQDCTFDSVNRMENGDA